MTSLVARAAFPKGNLYMRLRDELGTLYTDQDFAHLFRSRGQPALPAWRLALVTVMQFVENLSDRQAADAVRARIDWKYALGLELTDAGFHHSVLGEFRDRLIQGKAEQALLDKMLVHFKDKGLVKARGRQRTDSTHVLASIRVLRVPLNDLARIAPDWLNAIAAPEWYERYGRRIEESRLPKSEAARTDFAQQVGHDGFALLDALANPDAPTELRDLPTLEMLRQVWERHYERTEEGKARWRAGPELSRAATVIESPYNTQARHSSKRDTVWTGYKAHLSETCDADLPRLITHVHTTLATTQDVSCTEDIHKGLEGKDLLPRTHLVDTGYVDADLLVSSRQGYGVALLGPPRTDNSWQAREGGYDLSRFLVDWERERVTCPEGKVSVLWSLYRTKPYNYSVVKARFHRADCAGCAQRHKCIRSGVGNARTLTLPWRPQYEALVQARGQLASEPGRSEYRQRAGVEGTLSQAVRVSGLRQARYHGLAKTHLQHLATAAALNAEHRARGGSLGGEEAGTDSCFPLCPSRERARRNHATTGLISPTVEVIAKVG
jgi:transposase